MLGRMIGVCVGTILLWSGMGWTQAPVATPAPPSTSCEAQVSDVYRALAADRQVYDVPQGNWSQQLGAIGSQVRIVTHQYRMGQQSTEQAQGQAALQAEVVRQLQQNQGAKLGQLQQELDTALARVKELEEQGRHAAPTASR